MSRAHTIAMCDGGKSLHVDTEQARERGGFNLANLGEPLGHMRNGAVMLTQLLTDRRR